MGIVNGGQKLKMILPQNSLFVLIFPYKLPLTHDNLLNQIRTGSLFGYVQCDLEVPDELKSKFADFPPIFKNTEVSRNDIGEFMKNYASENKLLTQPQRMLISSFQLTNGIVITPLLNFYLSLGLRCTKITSLRSIHSPKVF